MNKHLNITAIAALLLATANARANEPVFDPVVSLDGGLGNIAELEVLDVNQDGKADLVVCSANGLGFHSGSDDWMWQAGPPTGSCASMDIVDADRDGRLDIAFGQGKNLRIGYGASDGWDLVTIPTTGPNIQSLRFVMLADGGDSYLDLVVARITP